jgi:hypothetical protein
MRFDACRGCYFALLLQWCMLNDTIIPSLILFGSLVFGDGLRLNYSGLRNSTSQRADDILFRTTFGPSFSL